LTHLSPSYLLLGSAIHFLLIRISLSPLQITLLGSQLLSNSSGGAIASLKLDARARIFLRNQGTVVSSAMLVIGLSQTMSGSDWVNSRQFPPIHDYLRIHGSIEALSVPDDICAATRGTSGRGVPIVGLWAQASVIRVRVAVDFVKEHMKSPPFVIKARRRLKSVSQRQLVPIGSTYCIAGLSKTMAVLTAHGLQHVAIRVSKLELLPRQQASLGRRNLDEMTAELVVVDFEVAIRDHAEAAKARPRATDGEVVELLQPEGLVGRLALSLGHVELIGRN
jgi:hypothetical protein